MRPNNLHDALMGLLTIVLIMQFYLPYFAAVKPNEIVNEEDSLRHGHLKFMKHYAQRSVNASLSMLCDRELSTRPGKEVGEFKKNLRDLITDYEAIKNPEDYSQIVENFGKLNDFYNEIPSAFQTADTQFIVNILKKYEADKITEEIKEKMSEFMANFFQALMG